ncbi:MAG: hypothetical protein K0S96_2323 [Geminicoccaceae bacterium]|nr:hypothetical protein [Geminicoccaceae bacterium]
MLRVEGELDRADRAVALLGDVEIGDAAAVLVALPPLAVLLVVLLVALTGARLGLGALQVVLVAVDEHHHVGVLLDRAGFAQIRELRPLVLALLDRARELGERQDRDVELLGDRLQALGDLGDLLHPVGLGGAADRPHQLQVVDHQHRQAVAPLEPARAGPERRDRQRRGVVDEQRATREVLARLDHALPLVLPELAAAQVVRAQVGLGGEQAHRELLGRHLEREQADRVAAAGQALGLRSGGPGRRGVGGDGDRERGLAHARARRQDHQVRGLQAAELVVEVDQPGRHAGDAAVLVIGRLDHGDGAGQHRRELPEAAFELALLREHEELLLGDLDLLAAALRHGRIVGLVDQLLADVDQAALEPEVVQQAAVVAGVEDRLGGAGEAREVARAVELAQRLVLVERDLEGQVVGEPALLDQPAHRLEDPAVHRLIEMLWPQELRDPVIGLVVDQDRAEQRLLGLDVVRLGAKAGRRPRLEGVRLGEEVGRHVTKLSPSRDPVTG